METNSGNSFDMGERSGTGGNTNSQRDETAAVGRTKNCTYSTWYHDQWRWLWLWLGTVHGTNNRPQHSHTVRTFLELIPRMLVSNEFKMLFMESFNVKQNGLSVFSFFHFGYTPNNFIFFALAIILTLVRMRLIWTRRFSSTHFQIEISAWSVLSRISFLLLVFVFVFSFCVLLSFRYDSLYIQLAQLI